MRIVHIADLHLGYRAYHRVNRLGQNVREADVAHAFDQALTKTIELEPDLVLIAGDVVHTVRPSNAVVAHAFRGFARLRKALPRVPILLIAGNHDSPRSSDTGNILTLFQEIPGIVSVTHGSQQVYIDALDTSVLCVPHNALVGGSRAGLEPDKTASTNILMLHGTIGGRVAEKKLRLLSEYGGERIEDRTIGPERWDYVALGHYHVTTALARNMWYAGSLERTSTNIWIEEEPKGFLLFDTGTREVAFHEVATRPMIDLPAIDARGLAVEEVDERIRSAAESVTGGLAGKLVRQRIINLPRHAARELDYTRIREYRATALHFQLDMRAPETVIGRHSDSEVAPTSAPRRPLEAEVFDWLRNRYAPSTPDIDKAALVSLAGTYLKPESEES